MLQFDKKYVYDVHMSLVHKKKNYSADSPQSKGQLISKWFLGLSISSKKRKNERIWLYYYDTQVDLFSFVFWRKSTTPKNHFEINWPLAH